MTSKVLKAYAKNGFGIDLGSPARQFSVLVDLKRQRTASCGGGVPVTDAFMFLSLARLYSPRNIFVIGNSFGLSTFILSDAFPSAQIDVIDAEIEGLDVELGSGLTRKIIASDFPNVKLTVGFSPADTPSAMRAKEYDFVFIDGLHTNEQMLLDFNGILPYCSKDCVVYFHDVGCCNMLEAWEKVKKTAVDNNFRQFELGFTQMGCTAIVRGLPEVCTFLNLAANPLNGPYRIGHADNSETAVAKRPWFWDLSFGYMEGVVRRKLRKVLRLGTFSSSKTGADSRAT